MGHTKTKNSAGQYFKAFGPSSPKRLQSQTQKALWQSTITEKKAAVHFPSNALGP